MLEERTEIIREILELFGTGELDIVARLKSGCDLSGFLKRQAVIYPYEYDNVLASKTGSFEELSDSLSQITALIRRKKILYMLCVEYCKYFLGETISYTDLTFPSKENTYRQYGHFDLRDESGKIDYTPFLEILGLNGDVEPNREPEDAIKKK